MKKTMMLKRKYEFKKKIIQVSIVRRFFLNAEPQRRKEYTLDGMCEETESGKVGV